MSMLSMYFLGNLNYICSHFSKQPVLKLLLMHLSLLVLTQLCLPQYNFPIYKLFDSPKTTLLASYIIETKLSISFQFSANLPGFLLNYHFKVFPIISNALNCFSSTYLPDLIRLLQPNYLLTPASSLLHISSRFNSSLMGYRVFQLLL